MNTDDPVLRPRRSWGFWVVLVLVVSALLGAILEASPPYARAMLWENVIRATPDEPPAGHPQPRTWDPRRVTVTWVGHATVLINFYGTTILTDPVFSRRIAPPEIFGVNVGIRRIMQLPLAFEALPPIDIVLLSHAHHDHWDLPTLRRFDSRTRVLIPSATRDLIPDQTFGQVTELGWDESIQVGALNVRAVRVNHWGQRWSLGGDGHKRGFNGYLLSMHGKRIFFAGDSAYAQHRSGSPFADWHALSALGPMDICLLPIGAYAYPYNHMSPESAWRLFNQLHGRYFVPIHWRTFILAPRSIEPTHEPIERLQSVAKNRADRIVAAGAGDVFVLPESP